MFAFGEAIGADAAIAFMLGLERAADEEEGVTEERSDGECKSEGMDVGEESEVIASESCASCSVCKDERGIVGASAGFRGGHLPRISLNAVASAEGAPDSARKACPG